MSIHRAAAAMHIREQMRCVGRCNPLRREMTPDVQISGIFPLFDSLMVGPRLPNCFLLCAAVVAEGTVARCEFVANTLDIFFHDRKFRFGGNQFFFRKPACVCAAETRANKFGAFLRQPATARSDGGHLRFEVRRWLGHRLQLGELFQ